MLWRALEFVVVEIIVVVVVVGKRGLSKMTWIRCVAEEVETVWLTAQCCNAVYEIVRNMR